MKAKFYSIFVINFGNNMQLFWTWLIFKIQKNYLYNHRLPIAPPVSFNYISIWGLANKTFTAVLELLLTCCVVDLL